jgi:hypothetical protein
MFHPHPFHHGDAHAVWDGWSGPKTNPPYDVFASPSSDDELEASDSLHSPSIKFETTYEGLEGLSAKRETRTSKRLNYLTSYWCDSSSDSK